MRPYALLLILGLIISSVNLNAQKFSTVDEDEELLENVVFDSLDIEENDDFSSFVGLDSIVKEKRVFFNGENHRFRYSNTKLQLKMLRYLYKEAGVRYLMMEFGYSRGWIVDEYINSEDTALYEILSLYSYKEYADFYKGIRAFNLTLPDTDRIHVIGMDLERFTHLPAKALSMQIPEGKAIPEEISLNIEAVIALAKYNDKWIADRKSETDDETSIYSFTNYSRYSSRRTLNTIIEDFEANDSIYKAYLGDNYERFARICTELKDHEIYDEYSSQPQMHIFRERYMFLKFKSFIKENPDAKIFGQFGRCHIAKQNQDETCPWQYFQAFANRVNSNSALSESVLSFGIYYPNGRDFYRMEESNPHITALADLAVSTGVSYTKITSDTAIFGVMTDFFDYLLINNISMEEEESMLEDTYDPYGYDYESNFVGFLSAGYFTSNQTLPQLNSKLKDLGYGMITTPLSEISIAFGAGERGGFVQKYEATIVPKTMVSNPADTSNAIFGGSNWYVKYGWDMVDVKWLHLQPYLGFGYSHYRLTYEYDATKVNPQTNTFGDPIIQEYVNPAFILDASFDMYIRIKAIGIGGTIGYRWDVSDPRWKGINGDLLDNSPDFSSTALYYGLKMALIF
jgi:hypothetical protein